MAPCPTYCLSVHHQTAGKSWETCGHSLESWDRIWPEIATGGLSGVKVRISHLGGSDGSFGCKVMIAESRSMMKYVELHTA